MVCRMSALHLVSLCKALQPSHLEHHLLQLIGRVNSEGEEEGESQLGQTIREACSSRPVVFIVESHVDVT